MMVAAPFGFYGSGNIGDEGTLKGFAALVELSGRPIDAVFASQDPKHTAAVEPAFRYHQYEGLIGGFWPRVAAHLARAYVFAGGTPIMDGLGDWPLTTIAPMVEHGAIWGKKSVFIGIGTERLEKASSRAIMSERIAPLAAHWSVRAEADKARLLDLAVPPERITVAADMAWLLAPAPLDYGRAVLADALKDGRPLIGVNINAETNVMARAPNMFKELAKALDDLIDAHDARVVFLFNEVRTEETFDLAAAKDVQALMRRADRTVITANAYLSPPQMMSIIGCCTMTISTRYHFCLFSARQGVPFLPIKRSDKVTDISADLDWAYGVAPEDTALLGEQGQALMGALDGAKQHLNTRVALMHERSKLNLKALDILFESAAKAKRSEWVKRVVERGVSRAARVFAKAS